MATLASRWRDRPETDRDRLVEHAAHALARGGLAVLPTETVYGLTASARHPDAVARLLRLSDGPGPPLTWHAGSVAELAETLDLPTRVHRRLADRLLPGPVRLDLEQPAHVIERLRAATAPGLIESSGRVAVRVPTHEAARRVLTRAAALGAGPLVAVAWDVPSPDGPRNDASPPTHAPSPDLPIVIEDGPPSAQGPASTLSLDLSGAFRVDPRGRLTDDDVFAALTRTILFICTGNTCRSPMAAAIARGLVAQRPEDGIATVIESAGVAASAGAPATPEGDRAVRDLGFDPGEHRAHPLTRAMLDRADAVFAMTDDHARRAARLHPPAAPKITTLDPDADVPDPFGSPQDVYHAAASRLRTLVGRRLDQLDAQLDLPPGHTTTGLAP